MNWKHLCFGLSLACLLTLTCDSLSQTHPLKAPPNTNPTATIGGGAGVLEIPASGHWEITYFYKGQANLSKSNSDSRSDPSKPVGGFYNTDPYSYLYNSLSQFATAFNGPNFSLDGFPFDGGEINLDNSATTGNLLPNGNTISDATVTKSINLSVSQFLTFARFTWIPDNDAINSRPPAQIQCIVQISYANEVEITDYDGFGPFPNGVSASATCVLTSAGINFPALNLTQFGLIDDANFVKKYVAIPTNNLIVVDYPIDTLINLRANYNGGSVNNGGANPFPYVASRVYSEFDITAILSGLALTSPSSAVFPTAGMNGNQYVFNTASPGVLNNSAWTAQLFGETKPASAYIGATTFDSFTMNGSARTQSNITASGTTLNQQFAYRGLPANNSDFGNKQVAVKVADDVNEADAANVQVFYNTYASNWPGTDKTTPNWFH